MRYSFSGSTLPVNIKSVSIPLFDNLTPRTGLEDKLHESVYSAFQANNALELKRTGGDAELAVRINSYSNGPDAYDAQGNVKTYRATIAISVLFRDRKENKALYEGDLVAFGIYDHTRETEDIGIDIALKKLGEMIINSTISGW